jgi:hypothetical protein
MRWKDSFDETMLKYGAVPVNAEKSVEEVANKSLQKIIK